MARIRYVVAVAVALTAALAGCTATTDSAPAPAPTPTTPEPVADSAGSTGANLADEAGGEEPAASAPPVRDPVADIRAAGWGVVGNRLRGPGGLDLDLSACPAEPPTEGPITIGTNVATGLLDAHAEAMADLFAEVNADGGIGGRRLELVTAVEDNGHWVNAEGKVAELVAEGDVVAVVPGGSAADEGDGAAAVLARACTPGLLWLGTGPSPSPWVVNGITDWRSDLALAIAWVHSTGARRVLAVGPGGADAFLAEIQDLLTALDARIPLDETVTVAAHGFDDPVGLRPVDPLLDDYDAAIIVSSGSGCTLAPPAIRERFPGTQIVTLSSLCPEWVFGPDYRAPDDGRIDGVVQLFATTPGAPDGSPERPEDRLQVEATRTAAAVVELLQVADRLDGGVSRANVLLAAHYLDLAPIDAIGGVRLRTNGPEDPFPVESGMPHRWDAATGRWRALDGGTVFHADGVTPPLDRRAREPQEPDPCRLLDRSTMSTAHWYPTEPGGDRVDPQADIVLHVPADAEPAATSAVLVASTDRGVEIRLPLAPGSAPACEGDATFDLPLGDAAALTELGPAFTVRFEFDGGEWSTDPVQWPGDFERAVPFDPTPLVRSPETDGDQQGG
ncbi:MAG: ABC transporter substrate-binding protein [Actinomycetota bacterium]